MSNVIAVTAKGEKAAMLQMDEGKPVWTPSLETAAKLEIGKPIPSDWTQKDGEYGPQAFPPKPQSQKYGGGVAAFRNTKEGQAIEQERMDRRTALMQAVASYPDGWEEHADAYFTWLRKTSGGAIESPAASVSTPSPTPQTKIAQERKPGRGMGAADSGQGAATSHEEGAASCLHPEDSITLLKPDGQPLPFGFWRCSECGKVAKDG